MFLAFDSCFDPRTVAILMRVLPDTYEVMQEMAPWVKRWPRFIECMDDETILDGRRRGAGHGQYSPDEKRIWINPYMSSYGVWLNLIHENMHHAFPDATEIEINNLLTPYVASEVLGHPIDLDQARLHGLGPAVKGIPGRGYAGT
jgi:hypothetical protein